MDIRDILVIGGGPTGLFASFYAGLRDAQCTLIDSLPLLGGRLTAVYPEKYIYDVPGFPKILAKDLVEQLVKQALSYQPTVLLNQAVDSLEKTIQDGLSIFKVTTKQGLSFYTRTVVICAGVGSYTPKKHPAPGAEHWENRGLAYGVLAKKTYAGKTVAIVGGGDSAVDWALDLLPVAKAVHVIHRTPLFRAHPASVKRLQSSTAIVHLNQEVTSFSGKEFLENLTLNHMETQEKNELKVDACLVFFGFQSSLGSLTKWGLHIEDGGITVDYRMQTNVDGIFAAGDIAHYPGKIKLIATGFSEAAIAVNFAKHYVEPSAKIQPGYSTHIVETKHKITTPTSSLSPM